MCKINHHHARSNWCSNQFQTRASMIDESSSLIDQLLVRILIHVLEITSLQPENRLQHATRSKNGLPAEKNNYHLNKEGNWTTNILQAFTEQLPSDSTSITGERPQHNQNEKIAAARASPRRLISVKFVISTAATRPWMPLGFVGHSGLSEFRFGLMKLLTHSTLFLNA